MNESKDFVESLVGGTAVPELQGALEEYLSLIVGLTRRGFRVLIISSLYFVKLF